VLEAGCLEVPYFGEFLKDQTFQPLGRDQARLAPGTGRVHAPRGNPHCPT